MSENPEATVENGTITAVTIISPGQGWTGSKLLYFPGLEFHFPIKIIEAYYARPAGGFPWEKEEAAK